MCLGEIVFGESALKGTTRFDNIQVSDAKSLYDTVVAENPSVSDKRSLINIRSIQQSVKPKDFRWVPTEHMVADGLTKLDWKLTEQMSVFLQDPVLICKQFSQQSYYYQLVPINNWQVTFFRAYPFPWELWIEDLNYNLVKLGESEQKPTYDQITEWTEQYEEKAGIRTYEKVGKLLQDKQQRLSPEEAAALAMGGAS
eukprot:s216_g23.t1